MNSEKQTIRVVAQFTFRQNIISLVAEEDCPPFSKGDIVKRVSRLTLSKMERPLNVSITRGGANINRINTYPVLIKQSENEN